jgi:hypothetical protein
MVTRQPGEPITNPGHKRPRGMGEQAIRRLGQDMTVD